MNGGTGVAVFVGSHRRAEAVLVSVEQYEALLEAPERQRAVAAALASVRAKGLEPGPEDLALFAAVAAGEMTTDELRERSWRGISRARCGERDNGPGSVR